MRIDLTIRSRDGSDRDVAVTAPDGTTFGDITAALAETAPGSTPAWIGRRRLLPSSRLGRGGLAAGAVLTERPDHRTDDFTGARLEIVGGPQAGHSMPITVGELDIGRAASCALTLIDPQASRRHAVVTVRAATVTVRDLGSTHGTFVDGVPVSGEVTLAEHAMVRIGDTFLTVREVADVGASLRDGPEGTLLVGRPPRAPNPLDDRVIELPSQPTRTPAQRVQWAAALLPAVAGLVLAWAMHSMLFVAFTILTPAALLASALGNRVHWRRDRRRAVASFRSRRSTVDRQIAAALRREARQRRIADPDPASVLRTARTRAVSVWQRRRHDADLLRLRIGLATMASAVQVDRGGAVGAAGEVPAVPRTIDLRAGPVGIAAPAPVRAGLARWLIGQLAVHVSPADVELALVLVDASGWTWTRWLPHLRAQVACVAAEHKALLDELDALVRSRGALTARGATWDGPWVVVVVDQPTRMTTIARLNAVLADGVSRGITALCLAARIDDLPSMCTDIVRADGDTGSTVRHGDTEVVADQVDRLWADDIGRALAPLRDAGADPSAALPDRCRLAELLATDPPTEAAIRTRWQRRAATATTVLGAGVNGPVILDLDRDGPHVLVAGTTGSGKSELLKALVIGLAASHPPTEVTFLLVDYKGGAAFAECGRLPHTVGVVTDLDGQLTRRVLASLNSEIHRRERLLAAAGLADSVAYRATGRAMPRLVLVVDEFAVLSDELPGFVPGLVDIAQRGRSLGLHLILATQRPAGVVSAEIRANTAVRVALRVTSVADSVDVIDAPEAAGVDRRIPGRGYLRAGTTTVAFQAAQVTGRSTVVERVSVVGLDEWRRPPRDPPATGATDAQRFVAAISAAANDLAPPRRPWLPPLPTRIALTDVPSRAPAVVPIGLVDLPAEQSQPPLTVDLTEGGAILIVGGARSGRTSAVLTLALSAAGRLSPSDLQLHAIDGAGSALAALDALPHLGTLASLHDGGDLAAWLLHRLEAELARGRDGRASAGRPERAGPTGLVLVDGWEALVSASDEYDGGRTIERLLALVRDAPAAGATVVITGGRAALTPRLAAAVGTRFVLRLHDPGDYAQAGVDAKAVPSVAAAGRAIRVLDGAEVQFAWPGDQSEQRRLTRDAGARWPGAAPPRLRLRRLPDRVTVTELGARPAHGCWLGAGGDEALAIAADLTLGARRLLIAGPARSGRSTVLCLILQQCLQPSRQQCIGPHARCRPVVAAPKRSPLARAARRAGLPVLDPGDDAAELPDHAMVLVDDCEAFAGTPVGDALTEWVRSDTPDRIALVAGRSDAMAIAFRGLATEVRLAGCGVLLQPGPLDGELLGVGLPRARPAQLPGRGVLVPDPAWRIGDRPLPIQVALPAAEP